jgi:drug/metabolite transporter (DMT)-like permease
VYLLTTVQIGVVTLCSLFLAIPSHFSFPCGIPRSVWIAVILTGVFATVFAFIGQTAAQKVTPPTRAALILLMESVFCALFARFYGGEKLPAVSLTGGGLMVVGLALAEVSRLKGGEET